MRDSQRDAERETTNFTPTSDAPAHGRRQRQPEDPLVSLITKWGKVAAALGAIAVCVGAVTAAVGVRLVGAPASIDSLAREVRRRDSIQTERTLIVRMTHDSLFREVRSLRTAVDAATSELALQSYIQCVQLRRTDPDLRPVGCDAATQRNRGR